MSRLQSVLLWNGILCLVKVVVHLVLHLAALASTTTGGRRRVVLLLLHGVVPLRVCDWCLRYILIAVAGALALVELVQTFEVVCLLIDFGLDSNALCPVLRGIKTHLLARHVVIREFCAVQAFPGSIGVIGWVARRSGHTLVNALLDAL